VNVPATMLAVVHQQDGSGMTMCGMPRAHALVHRGTKVCIVLIPVTAPGSIYRRWWASERSSVPTRQVIPAAFTMSVHHHNLMRQMQATCLAVGLSIRNREVLRAG
jgi:hypothetical protein